MINKIVWLILKANVVLRSAKAAMCILQIQANILRNREELFTKWRALCLTKILEEKNNEQNEES